MVIGDCIIVIKTNKALSRYLFFDSDLFTKTTKCTFNQATQCRTKVEQFEIHKTHFPLQSTVSFSTKMVLNGTLNLINNLSNKQLEVKMVKRFISLLGLLI